MPENGGLPSSIQFHHVKSNYFRVIHVNGAFGGFSPDGSVFMAIYSERPTLPDVTVQTVESTGQLGAEIIEQRKGREGIVRELEVGLSMDIKTARSLVKWLEERITLHQKFAAELQRKSESEIEQ
jgi:hypothetical protein